MAYGSDHTDRCIAYNTTLQPCDLKPNPAFINWIWFQLAFMLLDLSFVYSNYDMNIYVERFREFDT